MNEHWCITEWYYKVGYIVMLLLVFKTIVFGSRWPWQQQEAAP